MNKPAASPLRPGSARRTGAGASQPQAGFALMEVLLSVLIFTIGATATLALLLVARQDTVLAKDRNNAAESAQNLVSMIELDRANIANFADGAATPHPSRASWNLAVATLIPCVGCATGTQTNVAVPVANTVVISVGWRGPKDGSMRTFTMNAVVSGN